MPLWVSLSPWVCLQMTRTCCKPCVNFDTHSGQPVAPQHKFIESSPSYRSCFKFFTFRSQMAVQKFSRVKFTSFFPNVPRKFACRNAKTLVPPWRNWNPWFGTWSVAPHWPLQSSWRHQCAPAHEPYPGAENVCSQAVTNGCQAPKLRHAGHELVSAPSWDWTVMHVINAI